MAAYGADASSLPARMLKPQEFEVWPEHEDAVLMFLRVQTQWRTTSSGVMGLDYGVVLQLADLYAVEEKRQLMDDLQVMEGRARELINAEAMKAAKPQQPTRRAR